jgi:hypothetical protein
VSQKEDPEAAVGLPLVAHEQRCYPRRDHYRRVRLPPPRVTSYCPMRPISWHTAHQNPLESDHGQMSRLRQCVALGHRRLDQLACCCAHTTVACIPQGRFGVWRLRLAFGVENDQTPR